MSQGFSITRTCSTTLARAGVFMTPHGPVPTPVFIPVGSQGTIKTLSPQDLKDLGVRIVMANTYHLYLRPGVDIIERLGGLHRFMAWDGPLATDSGGFQVFSLGHLIQIDDQGLLFRSHLDGSQHLLTPEQAILCQERLGADIIMALDQCPPYEDDQWAIRRATERTHRWAARCLSAHQRADQALFGIVQGGTWPQLRRESAQFISSLPFPGYAIGGLSLGEPKEITWAILEETVAYLPQGKPRYLMGVGSPEDLVEGVARGVDMFDSALPTRLARNGSLFTPFGRRNIRNAQFRGEAGPIDAQCQCFTCHTFSAGYLHHLFKCEELLVYRLATIHNLHFITQLTAQIRQSIIQGDFPSFRQGFLQGYEITDEEVRSAQKQKWLQAQRRKPLPIDS